MPSQMKSMFGYLAYFAKGAEILPRVKPVAMEITYDGQTFKGRASTIFLALTNSVGALNKSCRTLP